MRDVIRKAPEGFEEIEVYMPLQISLGHAGDGTKKEWLWFSYDILSSPYIEELTDDKLQEVIDSAGHYLDELLKLRDSLK